MIILIMMDTHYTQYIKNSIRGRGLGEYACVKSLKALNSDKEVNIVMI